MSLTFICKNPDCSAPEVKKGKEYPVAMDCPFCDVPLSQESSFSDFEERLINSLPYLIAYPLKRTLLESHPWSKLNLFKDTFLNYLKYLGLLTASEFFASELKNKNMVSLFQNTLAEPSFGTWNTYIRETLKFLKENDHRFFIPELLEYYEHVESGKKRKLYTGNIEVQNLHGETQIKKQEATGIGMLINFRNRYLGHGLTLDERESKALWEEYSPIFFTLVDQLHWASKYVMYKNEHGSTVRLHTAELLEVEHSSSLPSQVWIENPSGDKLDIVPFFVVPGELSIAKEDKEQLLAYEAYTGKTIKFFSPEGTEKQSSGRTLERLNLLLRDKQNENTYCAEAFSKEVFAERIREENRLLVNTLIAERKVMPGIYVHREEMEIRIREWIGARMSIMFIAAEAGSGKTNLLVEAQRQYQEKGLHSLVIRAGRMEKGTLLEQLTYMLNLEKGRTLSDYPAIAGTQDAPTFILIDGLNEASHSEAIWLEILALAQMFDPGSIKFIVTSRANTSADLDRYILCSQEEDLLYRDDNKEGTDLRSAAFWLTALNMAEMKEAWQLYASKDKSRFKPLFSFDDIAGFDRGIYDQISNPLILRIFLEVYNGKQLASKGKKILNIWQDWLATFSSEERAFMELLAKRIWESGVNELLLDDLLHADRVKEYLLSDALNSPYQRLKSLGWLSRYTKDLNLVVGFTVEGLLLHLLAIKLDLDSQVGVEFIQLHATKSSELKISAIEQFLAIKAAEGNLELVKDLIDEQGSGLHLCTQPLLNFARIRGAHALVETLLLDPTEGDWIALNALDRLVEDLSMHTIRREIAFEAIRRNELMNDYEIESGLGAILLLNDEDSRNNFNRIGDPLNASSENLDIIEKYGEVLYKFGMYERALNYFEHSVLIRSNDSEPNQLKLASSYNNLGKVLYQMNNFILAQTNFQKSLELKLSLFGPTHPLVAASYNNLGAVNWKLNNESEALNLNQKSLEIRLMAFGTAHPSVAKSYMNIAIIYSDQKNFNKAKELFEESLKIRIKTLGQDHLDVASTMFNFGNTLVKMKDLERAIELYKECQRIRNRLLGSEHPLSIKASKSLELTKEMIC
jgi:tetratricopeptide (TPR) repeat protein